MSDKTKANHSAGLSGTMEVERPRYRVITTGSTAGKRKHQVTQSAVSELGGLKLGNEVTRPRFTNQAFWKKWKSNV